MRPMRAWRSSARVRARVPPLPVWPACAPHAPPRRRRHAHPTVPRPPRPSSISTFGRNNFGVLSELLSLVGAGCYPPAALLNHSCAPSCALAFDGATLEVRPATLPPCCPAALLPCHPATLPPCHPQSAELESNEFALDAVLEERTDVTEWSAPDRNLAPADRDPAASDLDPAPPDPPPSHAAAWTPCCPHVSAAPLPSFRHVKVDSDEGLAERDGLSGAGSGRRSIDELDLGE